MGEQVKNLLTEDEIQKYVCEEDRQTGVKGISEDYLRAIDLNKVPEVDIVISRAGKGMHIDGKCCYTVSDYCSPSFAGRQLLLGRVGRKLYFSDGVWFSTGVLEREARRKE